MSVVENIDVAGARHLIVVLSNAGAATAATLRTEKEDRPQPNYLSKIGV